jgi:hypothetical protein
MSQREGGGSPDGCRGNVTENEKRDVVEREKCDVPEKEWRLSHRR